MLVTSYFCCYSPVLLRFNFFLLLLLYTLFSLLFACNRMGFRDNLQRKYWFLHVMLVLEFVGLASYITSTHRITSGGWWSGGTDWKILYAALVFGIFWEGCIMTWRLSCKSHIRRISHFHSSMSDERRASVTTDSASTRSTSKVDTFNPLTWHAASVSCCRLERQSTVGTARKIYFTYLLLHLIPSTCTIIRKSLILVYLMSPFKCHYSSVLTSISIYRGGTFVASHHSLTD